MRGDIIAAGIISIIGAFLLVTLFGVLDEGNYDRDMEYEDWIEFDTTTVIGSEGPIEIADGMIHAVGTGDARLIREDGSAYRIRILPAHADLILINGQSNAAYYKADGRLPDAADLQITPAPQLGKAFYFGSPSRMPYREADDVSTFGIYDFVSPDGAVRVGDKGPGFCKAYTEATGKKALWVSLGIPSKRIAAWDQPNGSAWTQDIRIMEAFNDKLKDSGFVIDRTIVLWAQGESDLLHNTGYAHYISSFQDLHDAAPAAWDHEIDGWYLIEGRTENVGWVNQAFAQLASDIQDVRIAVGSCLPDSFSVGNGFMEPDDLHYSQLGDNAIASAAARYASGNDALAPIYLMQDTLTVDVDGAADPPATVKLYKTDGSSALASVTWDGDVDTSSPGTQIVTGRAQGVDRDMCLQFTPEPMLIVDVEAAS